jgi:hypothetical protein
MELSSAEKKRILMNGFGYPWFFSLFLGSLILSVHEDLMFRLIFPFFIISFLFTIPYVFFIYFSIYMDKIKSVWSLFVFQVIGFALTVFLLTFMIGVFSIELLKFGLVYFVTALIMEGIYLWKYIKL